MISIEQVLTSAKEQLNLTHTNSQDSFLALKINEAIGKMNNLIRLTCTRCHVPVIQGYSAKPEGFVQLVWADIAGFPYTYVNQTAFNYYGLLVTSDSTSKSIVDSIGVVKETHDGRLDWGAQTIDGTADLVYIKLNKVNGQYLIPDNCEMAAAYYACAMYQLRMKDYPAYSVYNQLWNANSGVANSQAIHAEFDQDKATMRYLINDMLAGDYLLRMRL